MAGMTAHLHNARHLLNGYLDFTLMVEVIEDRLQDLLDFGNLALDLD